MLSEYEDGTEVVGIKSSCDLCNKELSGKAFRFEGKYYHPKCYLMKANIYLVTKELEKKKEESEVWGTAGEYSSLGL